MEEDPSSTTSKQKKLAELLTQLGSPVDRKEAEPAVSYVRLPVVEPPMPTYSPAPQVDWSSDITKLLQKRAQIRDKIETTLTYQPAATDESLSHPDLLSDLYRIEQGHERVAVSSVASSKASPVLADEAQPLPIAPLSASRQSFWSGKSTYFIGILVCLISLGGAELFWLFQQNHTPLAAPTWQVTVTPLTTSTVMQTPTVAQQTALPAQAIVPTVTPVPSPTATPTKASKTVASSSRPISFESGNVDGWHTTTSDAAVNTVKNVKTKQAKDGSHILMVSFDSDNGKNDDSYPSLATSNLPASLKARQTITAYVLKQKGSNVQASLYAVDQAGKWYKAIETKGGATLVKNDDYWYPVTFTLPASFKGSAAQVGIVLFGYSAVVYIDDISWHN